MQKILNRNLKYNAKDTFEPSAGSANHFSAGIRGFRENRFAQERLSNRIITALPLGDLVNLLKVAENVKLPAGQSIYRHGDNIEFVYFPETAVFSQIRILEDGKTCETAMIGKEGFAGLPAICESATAACWTEISVAGKALKINVENFRQKLSESEKLRAKIAEYENCYIEQISQRAACNCFHDLKERFCSWLLMLEERCEQNKFLFTQEAIARLLGVHRPSLSCVVKELKNEKIIDYARGWFVIPDRAKLQSLACACGKTADFIDYNYFQ
ncbi:MAG: Crp/Fnr family transcriptional regulator [Pyrinomonadaceae bacterium]